MGVTPDLVGRVFGHLTVVERHASRRYGPRNSVAVWSCTCACGKRRLVPTQALVSGRSTSCGRCSHRTHGLSHTKIYAIWANMKDRCSNPRAHKYKDYGGRGITFDERWRTFETFYADMGSTYTDGLSIDRIDNDGNYTRDNCRWVGMDVQQNNKGRAADQVSAEVAQVAQDSVPF